MSFNFLNLALALLMTQGETALRAALTVPEATVKAITKKTGADLSKAMKERDELATAWVEFVQSMASNVHSDELVPVSLSVETSTMNANPTLLAGGLIDLAVTLFRLFGRGYVTRWLTPPQSFVAQVCARTGADFATAIIDRNKAVEELVEFIESLVNKNFVDPD